jgi:hypothetical protein
MGDVLSAEAVIKTVAVRRGQAIIAPECRSLTVAART